jgi:hypothetical protein
LPIAVEARVCRGRLIAHHLIERFGTPEPQVSLAVGGSESTNRPSSATMCSVSTRCVGDQAGRAPIRAEYIVGADVERLAARPLAT